MAWKKLGMVFDLSQHKLDWIKSHAMLPTPLVLEDRIRVYYTYRDANGLSRISFVDLDPTDPRNILYVHQGSLFDIGKPGTFDDSGVLGNFALRKDGKVYLFYNGYNRRVVVPWSNAIGVAESDDGGTTFRKMYEGPIFDRDAKEPYFSITPWMLEENGLWHIWYTSGTGWVKKGEIYEPLYVVKYATTQNGLDWNRHYLTCIPPKTPEEANARAAVVKDGNQYKMWLCYRGSDAFRDGADSYRIGYATATTPTDWTRDDEQAGIAPGPEEYDDKMQAYPAVVDAGGKRYLFYNGNGFGYYGFCCAEFVE
ncbi:MAG: hypothetical protein LDL27_05720 [Desulfovibrio sp.]|nr:hypothetical protein [Desulfovibrio sp.]